MRCRLIGRDPNFLLGVTMMTTKKYIKELIYIAILFIIFVLVPLDYATWFKITLSVILFLSFILETISYIISVVKARKNDKR